MSRGGLSAGRGDYELLERLRDHPLFTLTALALHTGARRNELLALRWRDIDLDAAKLTIEQSLEQTSALGIRVKAPKTKKGKRTISLPAAAVEALRAHWRAQQEQRLALGIGRSWPIAQCSRPSTDNS